jgi:hypothetical protein
MKLWASLLVCVVLCLPASGARADGGFLPSENRAKFMTDRMTSVLGLTADQVTKVAALNLETARKIDEIRLRHAPTHDENEADIRDAKKDRENLLHEILDAKQWELYVQKKGSLNEEQKAWAQQQHAKNPAQ